MAGNYGDQDNHADQTDKRTVYEDAALGGACAKIPVDDLGVSGGSGLIGDAIDLLRRQGHNDHPAKTT